MVKATSVLPGDVIDAGEGPGRVRVERVSDPHREYGRRVVTFHGRTVVGDVIATVTATPEQEVYVY